MKMSNNLTKPIHNKQNAVTVSFIVPCLNEEKHIGKLLQSIYENVKNVNYELIIVDNGSTDNSIEIIKSYNAKLVIDKNKTIGGLRNVGAELSVGDFLIFLDADTIITKNWNEEILTTFNQMNEVKMVTGSRCSIGISPSFIENNWFKPMMNENNSNYINSAHLIVKKKDFFEIGQFSISLVTAEDYDFCKRARENGFKIVNNPKLIVIHEGYPKTIIEFVRRERWHGGQDFSSLRSILQSKVAIFSLLYIVTLIFSVISFFLKFFHMGIIFLCIDILISFAAAIEKMRRYQLNIFVTFLIYNVYFFARSLSLIDKLVKKPLFRWERS